MIKFRHNTLASRILFWGGRNFWGAKKRTNVGASALLWYAYRKIWQSLKMVFVRFLEREPVISLDGSWPVPPPSRGYVPDKILFTDTTGYLAIDILHVQTCSNNAAILMVYVLYYCAAEWSKMKPNTCGLEGSVQVFTHVDTERRTCWGRLTDWNDRRCGSEARLRLRLYGRCTVTDRMTTSGTAMATDGYIELGQIQIQWRNISSQSTFRRGRHVASQTFAVKGFFFLGGGKEQIWGQLPQALPCYVPGAWQTKTSIMRRDDVDGLEYRVHTFNQTTVRCI